MIVQFMDKNYLKQFKFHYIKKQIKKLNNVR